MNSYEIQNMRQAYMNVYEATGREEMIAANIARARQKPEDAKPAVTKPAPTKDSSSTSPETAKTTPSTSSTQSTPETSSTSSSSSPSSTGSTSTSQPTTTQKSEPTPKNSLDQLNRKGRDTAGRAGEVVGRERGRRRGIPGAGLLGGLIGKRNAQRLYDKGVEKLIDLIKEGYELETLEYILEYLVDEGYANTHENALVIVTNMSENWRTCIIEELLSQSTELL